MRRNGRFGALALCVATAVTIAALPQLVASAATPSSAGDSAFTYTGTWTAPNPGGAGVPEHWTTAAGATATVAVDVASEGGTISVSGTSWSGDGYAQVAVDQATPVYADTYRNVACCTARAWWTSPVLAAGRHTVTVTVPRLKSAAASDYAVSITGVSTSNGGIVTAGSAPTSSPTSSPTAAPTTNPSPSPSPTPTTSPVASHFRYYGDTAATNVAIPASPVLDPNSASWATALGSNWTVESLAYSTAVVYADGSETTYDVPTTHDGDWGDAIPATKKVPLRSTWKASPGSDAWLVVVSADRTYAWWLWQYNWNNGSPKASWGGSGAIGAGSNPPASPWASTGGGNGSGFSMVAGIITDADLSAGSINHALAVGIPQTSSAFRVPATKSDGGSGPIPEGARLQLDPSLNVDAQTGWTPLERMVAKALQTYGAYVTDSSGGNGFGAQMDQGHTSSNPGPMWNAVGVTGDYPSLSHIPWNQIRVLETWNGQ